MLTHPEPNAHPEVEWGPVRHMSGGRASCHGRRGRRDADLVYEPSVGYWLLYLREEGGFPAGEPSPVGRAFEAAKREAALALSH